MSGRIGKVMLVLEGYVILVSFLPDTARLPCQKFVVVTFAGWKSTIFT